MNFGPERSSLPALALAACLAAFLASWAVPAGAQGLDVPETPIEQVPEAKRAAAQKARTGAFAEFRKLAIARAEAALKLQAFRKSLRGKEVTEQDEKEIARLNEVLSKASDRMDDWASAKELTPEDLAAMEFIQDEVTKAALEWARKNAKGAKDGA